MRTSATTQLIAAIRSRELNAVQEFIQDYRQNPTERLDINSALCEAANTGHREIVRLLLRMKADVTFTDCEGKRALHYAAEIGSPEVVKQILNAGSPVNVADGKGFTSLHYASISGRANVVLLLIEEGAAINRARTYYAGETALHLASKSGHTDVVRVLLSKGAHINSTTTDEKMTSLHLAVRGRHLETVRFLCELGCDLNQVDIKGRTPLSLAAEHSALDIVQTLLEYGADPALFDCKGLTPLHNIANITQTQSSHLKIAEEVINSVNDVDVRDNQGSTPLHCAASSGNVEISVLLLTAGANIDAQEYSRGETPLALAIGHQRVELIKMLTSMGADVNISDKDKISPLHKIQGLRKPEKAELTDLLLRHGAKLNTCTNQGYTPLDRCVFHFVIGNKNEELLKRLVIAGAHLRPIPNTGRRHHNSPLCWLTYHGELSSAKFLVHSGWDLRKEAWILLPGKDDRTDEFLNWLREEAQIPRTLKRLCRISIREHLNRATDDTDISLLLEDLPLPTIIKQMLNLEEEVYILECCE